MAVVTVVLATTLVAMVEGQADLLASVIEFSDYTHDPEVVRRLDNTGVPVNVIQRPNTGARCTVIEF